MFSFYYLHTEGVLHDKILKLKALIEFNSFPFFCFTQTVTFRKINIDWIATDFFIFDKSDSEDGLCHRIDSNDSESK